jgi:nuclear pore complex protein Nup93
MDQARCDGACSRQNNATTELLTTPRNNITNMSLFGNLGGNQPAGSAAPASASTFGSLFGNKPATTSAAPAGGLFGSLGGATSGATSNTAQPASSGGFGSSLFGGVLGAKAAASPAPASSAPTGGLFGGAATAQPQTQTTSLFGGLGGATQQSTANQPSNLTQPSGIGASSLFGATTTQQPQQQQGAPLAQANAGTGRSAHFDHLLERGRKRNAGENGLTGFDELPSLQLGLGDIARKVRNLGAGGPSAAQAQDGQQDRAA